MTTPLNKSDFKIVYFHLPNQNEEEDLPKGCVVVHNTTSFAGVGENPNSTVKENLITAFKTLVGKAKLPAEEVDKLFSCPTCNQERLPNIPKWKPDHSYEYVRKFTGNDHPSCPPDVKFSEDSVLCTARVYKSEEDIFWYWSVDDEHEEPLGFSQFPEDAIEAVEKYALEVVSKSIKADELEPRE